MLFTAKEMQILCMFHSGTFSATVDVLRMAQAAEGEQPKAIALIKSTYEKLSGMKAGETVSLAFDPEG